MKNLFKYTLGVLFAGLTMTACSPEEFEGADPNGIPTVSGIDYQIAVDQETNQMVASYTPAAGTYPIWILNGTQYSTLQEVGYNNPEAGTYTVELRLGNRNGISQTGIKKEFTFNETKVDYSADFRRICNKEWRFANREVNGWYRMVVGCSQREEGLRSLRRPHHFHQRQPQGWHVHLQRR